MFYNAKNGSVKIGNADMDYISFGRGNQSLIMIPGVGDGLKTVKNMAVPMAMMYRQYAKTYKVYVFSRKQPLAEAYSTRDMARDQKEAMEKLGIQKAHIMGVSQGGMIAQYLAIDYPQLVEKLVLVVSLAKANDTIKTVVGSWIEMAKAGDYKGIFIDSTEKSYSESYVKRYRPFYPLLSRVSKPKDLERFTIQAQSCLCHDAGEELGKIDKETLLIGAEEDKVVGKGACEELAASIKGSKLYVYKGLGHGVYEEAKDFHRLVLAFLQQG